MIQLLKLLNFRHVKSHLLLHFSETLDLGRLLKLKTHNLYGKIYMKMLHFQEKTKLLFIVTVISQFINVLLILEVIMFFSTRLLKPPYVSQVQNISQDF